MEVTVDGENSGARVNEFMWSSGCCCRPGSGAIIERLSKYFVFIPSFCCFCWASLCGGPCEASSNKTAYCTIFIQEVVIFVAQALSFDRQASVDLD